VRPDQHVAWRGDDWPGASERLFEQLTGRLRSPVRTA
jgi:hypothetical protein